MTHRFSLFSYLLTIILISSSIVLGIVVIGNRTLIERVLLSNQEEKFDDMTQEATTGVELRLAAVEEAIHRNALLFSDGENHSRDAASQILEQTLNSFPTIFAMEIIYTETEAYLKKESGFDAIYAYRNQVSDSSENTPRETDNLPSISIVDRTDIETDYQADWFTEPVKQQDAVWSPPYQDPQIGVWMVTYSVPVFSEPGHIKAVMTADVSLEWLGDLIDSFPIRNAGEPVLITQTQIIYRSGSDLPKQHGAMEEGKTRQIAISDFNQNFHIDFKSVKGDTENQNYSNIADFLAKNSSGKFRYKTPKPEGKKKRFYFSTLPKISWKLGYAIPESQIKQTVYWLTKRVVGFGIIGVILLIIPSFFIARSVANPLSALSRCAKVVAEGNFDEPLPVIKGNGEIPQLFRAFDTMRNELKRYIRDITEAAKKEEHMQSQLRIAHSIQQGMVPKNFESARSKGLDLYAEMKPAQDVGGDLYDYAVLENGDLYFCLGDVSGKGVPASIFMAIGKTLIRSAIQRDGDPARALSWVNNQLMENNEAGLFITALCGIYSVKNHEILISCAGHNPPFIRNADGKTERIDITNGRFPLAMMEDVEYENFKIPLPPGSKFFLYTDGVTDAVNPENEFFGEKNLQKYLGTVSDDSAKSIVEMIVAEITRFANGAKQSDDITLMAFSETKK